MASKTHVYPTCTRGHEYFIDTVEDPEAGEQLIMTSWGIGVRCLDYIVFLGKTESKRYQIERIHYYCRQRTWWIDRSDLWIALLVRCS